MQLLREVEVVARAYVRKGGKDNRRQQRARMLAFAEHAAASGVNSLGQLGKAHVIAYWKSHRELATATAYSHWLAIRQLWKLGGKSGEPPKPRAQEKAASPSLHPQGLTGAG